MTGTPHPGRRWLRASAAILAVEAIAAILYAPFLPTPILPEIGVAIPIIGQLTAFWFLLGAAYLAAAAGVTWRRPWGRALAAVMAVVLLAISVAGVLSAVARAEVLLLPGSLVGIGLYGIVLYAVLRKWPPAASARP